LYSVPNYNEEPQLVGIVDGYMAKNETEMNLIFDTKLTNLTRSLKIITKNKSGYQTMFTACD